MRLRRWFAGAEHANIGVLVALWLVCAPVAWFFVQLAQDVPIHQGRVLAASFGWAGEPGQVTISDREEVFEGGGRGGGSKRTHCFGTFTPADGSAPLPDLRVHIGSCELESVADARLIRADHGSWLLPNETDQAYAGGSWGRPLVLLLFMGTFTLIVGVPFVLCAVLFPLMLVLALHRRRRAASADEGSSM
ncbi:hypothetical protein RM844_00370 [Streptomyces sp. DSM 44915]|uniref:Uncharacterized protein n=1 Tax=Streptomyces chisholmiae TaxID=3075540 RepID=A0ABU2JIC0_9ACTN|nr:hypothetical protein [Streptomyces sp. DSM 44915]MDT0264737.1 hypothetical protein [Streptomyces sp. DSM 44915]